MESSMKISCSLPLIQWFSFGPKITVHNFTTHTLYASQKCFGYTNTQPAKKISSRMKWATICKLVKCCRRSIIAKSVCELCVCVWYAALAMLLDLLLWAELKSSNRMRMRKRERAYKKSGTSWKNASQTCLDFQSLAEEFQCRVKEYTRHS